MEIKPELETFAKIKVVGIGSGGNSAVNRMYSSNLAGVEFVAVNTDAQALHSTKIKNKIHIGKTLTRGLGAGKNPEIGKQAAEEDQEEIKEVLKDSDMVFLTCGLGGGTGSGGTPVIANIAKEAGALTVGVVTKPFSFEGGLRGDIANKAHSELKDKVDALITIPNDKLLRVIDKKTSLMDAFSIVDDVLKQAVQGISDLVTVPGIVNVDFADVKSIMQDAGSALMGIGTASGENRAVEAAKRAIKSPLLELSINGATGVLFNISGGEDLGMLEIDEAAKIITESVDPGAKIIFGAVRDKNLNNELRITVIATGFNKDEEKTEGNSLNINNAGKESTKAEDIFGEFDSQAVSDNADGGDEKNRAGKSNDKLGMDNAEDELDIPAFIRKKMDNK